MKLRPAIARIALLFGAAAVAKLSAQTTYTVTTLAGLAGAVVNSVDATGAAAQFDTPRGLTVDSSGNLYVADSSNHTIRKITPAGVVTTLAGTAGSQGRTDGTGATARFTEPFALTVDATGTIYVADTSSNNIRKITAAGVVTTFAGTGLAGATDGTGTAASFHEPRGIARDTTGNFYIADYENNIVRKITAAGVVTTLAGTANQNGTTDGTGAAARFNALNGIVVDSAGNIFVADGGARNIRKITPAGVVTTFTAASERFSEPRGLAIDSSDNLYLADYGSHSIRKITPAGTTSVFAGLSGTAGIADGTGTAARFHYPSGIVADTSGNLYVADSENDTIRKITSAGVVTTIAGTSGRSSSTDGTGAAARFEDPFAIAVDTAGNTYVADSGAHCIRKITAAGVVTTLAGLPGTFGSTDGTGASARFYAPTGIAVDTAGNVYVADNSNRTVRKITSGGVVTTLAGLAGNGAVADGTGTSARFSAPHGITVDSSGNVYVADSAMHTIRKITAEGVVTTLAGTSGTAGSTDGTGTAATFAVPYGLTVDSTGNLYVCDHSNHIIRKVTPAGVVTTVAGTAGASAATDGTGPAARFKFPSDVKVDSNGNLYVADTDNQIIRKITAAGVVTTIAGSGNAGSTDAVGTSARFLNPKGIAVDNAGHLYIVDRGNRTIRKATATAAAALSISTQPASQSVGTGSAVTLSVSTAGTPAPTTYQWSKNGVAISGATSASYTIAAATAADAGNYTCVVGNGVTSITSSAAVLTVTVGSRLSNLSVRTTLSANQVLTVGFTMSEGAKNLLVRAAGPGLGALGVPGTMADPKLTLFNGSTQIGTNDNWAGNAAVSAAISAVGAFPFPSSASLDAALVASVDGGRTVQVSGPAAGNLIVEAYDAGTGNSPRLTNLSALNRVGTGGDVLIAGFTLTGTGTKNVLIRAIGPSLTTLGVSGVLADPKLELYNSAQAKIGENDTYAPSLSSTFSTVGAFPLTAGSKDAAFIVSLPAGGYTVQVSGADGGTGLAIVELYELP